MATKDATTTTATTHPQQQSRRCQSYGRNGTRRLLLQISFINDTLRPCGIPPPLLTRPIHDLREAMTAFEGLKVFSDYRTPINIRAFIRLCVFFCPLFLCPHFAALQDYGFPFLAYATGTLVTLLFILLQGVQRKLENPFLTSHGRQECDDIRLDNMTFEFITDQNQFSWISNTASPPQSPILGSTPHSGGTFPLRPAEP